MTRIQVIEEKDQREKGAEVRDWKGPFLKNEGGTLVGKHFRSDR